jgi:hypothetical protein
LQALFWCRLFMWLPAACERIVIVRLVALLLTFAIAGPSVGALICDWTCASAHQTASAAETNCHDAPGPSQTATFAAGHACHELPAPAACVVTCTTSLDGAAVTVDTAVAGRDVAQASFVIRRPDRAHAPPPTQLVALRI